MQGRITLARDGECNKPESETRELLLFERWPLTVNISELSFFMPLLDPENPTQEHNTQKHLASYIVPVCTVLMTLLVRFKHAERHKSIVQREDSEGA